MGVFAKPAHPVTCAHPIPPGELGPSSFRCSEVAKCEAVSSSQTRGCLLPRTFLVKDRSLPTWDHFNLTFVVEVFQTIMVTINSDCNPAWGLAYKYDFSGHIFNLSLQHQRIQIGNLLFCLFLHEGFIYFLCLSWAKSSLLSQLYSWIFYWISYLHWNQWSHQKKL